jgi:two-component system, OmpR family, sensor kinase
MWHSVWHSSIKNRLTFLFFCITAGAILVFYFYVVPQLESTLTQQKTDALERDSSAYTRSLQGAITREVTAPELDRITRAISEETGTRVTLLGIPRDEPQPGLGAAPPEEGSPPYVISDSRRADKGVEPSSATVLKAARTGSPQTTTRAEGGAKLAQVARPLLYQGRPSWVVVFSQPLDDVEGNVSTIQRQILIAGLLALLLATATGYFAASALARRVKRLEHGAREVAAGNFSEPIPIDSDDELGQLARAFNEMQNRLARLDTARKEFIANASHELRTPIFSLGGFVELLQDEDLDEDTRAEFLATMREQVDRLQKLTTDLLDLSRLDAGSIDLELEPVPLRTLANQVAGEFAAAAARKDTEIEVADRESQLDIEAVCDPERVAQIVRVLIDNALVHTPEGTRVTISAGRGSAPGSPDTAQLFVTDDGPGIRRRDLATVFERFHTSDSAQGSGLGLAIARELAQRMRGGLEVTSKPGTTTFTLTLPLAGEREQPARPAAAVQPPPAEVRA